MAVRIVVADDDRAVLAAVVDTLEADSRYEVVGTATDADSAVAAVLEQRPAAALLDIRMPGGGVSAARRIQESGLPVTITVASAKVDAAVVADLLRAGVRGVFTKGQLGNALGDLISQCLAGHVVLMTPSAAEGVRLYGRDGEPDV